MEPPEGSPPPVGGPDPPDPAEQTIPLGKTVMPPPLPVRRKLGHRWRAQRGLQKDGKLYDEHYHVLSLLFKLFKSAAVTLLAVIATSYMVISSPQNVTSVATLVLIASAVAIYWGWQNNAMWLVVVGAFGLLMSALGLAIASGAWLWSLVILAGFSAPMYWVARVLTLWKNIRIILTPEVISLCYTPPWWTFRRRSELSVPLHDISSVEPTKPWWLPMWLKCGHLVVDTPGQRDEEFNENLQFIWDPYGLATMIKEAIAELGKYKAPPMKFYVVRDADTGDIMAQIEQTR